MVMQLRAYRERIPNYAPLTTPLPNHQPAPAPAPPTVDAFVSTFSGPPENLVTSITTQRTREDVYYPSSQQGDRAGLCSLQTRIGD